MDNLENIWHLEHEKQGGAGSVNYLSKWQSRAIGNWMGQRSIDQPTIGERTSMIGNAGCNPHKWARNEYSTKCNEYLMNQRMETLPAKQKRVDTCGDMIWYNILYSMIWYKTI